MEEKLVALNIRVPERLKKLIKQYIALDTHKDLSEFTRDAIREKIQRDAPHLYSSLFESCPKCGSKKVWKDGLESQGKKSIERFLCGSCGFRFSRAKKEA